MYILGFIADIFKTAIGSPGFCLRDLALLFGYLDILSPCGIIRPVRTMTNSRVPGTRATCHSFRSRGLLQDNQRCTSRFRASTCRTVTIPIPALSGEILLAPIEEGARCPPLCRRDHRSSVRPARTSARSAPSRTAHIQYVQSSRRFMFGIPLSQSEPQTKRKISRDWNRMTSVFALYREKIAARPAPRDLIGGALDDSAGEPAASGPNMLLTISIRTLRESGIRPLG